MSAMGGKRTLGFSLNCARVALLDGVGAATFRPPVHSSTICGGKRDEHANDDDSNLAYRRRVGTSAIVLRQLEKPVTVHVGQRRG
jgi:hypothetical protein